MNILHNRPNDRQTTRFCREGINLVCPLPNIAEKAFDGIGGANVTMHDLWEGIKCQEMLFIFTETPDRFWIAFLLFRLESCQIEHCVFLLLLLKDPC